MKRPTKASVFRFRMRLVDLMREKGEFLLHAYDEAPDGPTKVLANGMGTVTVMFFFIPALLLLCIGFDIANLIAVDDNA